MQPSHLAETLQALIPVRAPVLIKGAPGVGKTDIVKQTAEKLEQKLLIAHPVVDDPVDYKGLPFLDKGRADFKPIGHLRELVETQEPTIFFLDDLGQAPPAVQAACMQLLLSRSINEHKVSDHVTFLAATNRKEDRAGVAGILEPVKSRFISILNLEPNLDDWTAWAWKAKMPTELIAFLRFRPNLLHKFEATADITNSPCPRTVANVGKILKSNLRHEFYPEVIAGAAGEGFAAELLGFLEIYGKMPDPKEVLDDPKAMEKDLKKITDEATIFALCIGMSEYVDQKTAGNFFKAIDYFDPEYGFAAAQCACKRDVRIAQHEAHTKWAMKNKHFVL